MTGRSYEEIVEGESLLRLAPPPRHEQICDRLHDALAASVGESATICLLPPRTVVQLSAGTLVRPDLTLMTREPARVWLVAEIVNAEDHRIDTVTKKMMYEDLNLPRLWMIDPRYDNVEVYHASQYGLTLRRILAGSEMLEDASLPQFGLKIADLFRGDS